MNQKNIKDKLSDICGVLLVISGCVLSVATAGVMIPVQIVTVATVAASVSGGVIAYLTGKNPDGTKKTQEQIDKLK